MRIDPKTGVHLIPPDILRDILIEEMQLIPNMIWVYNPNYKMPSFPSLFVVVRFDYSKPYSNRNKVEDQIDGVATVYTEGQFLNMQEFYAISLLSRDLSALQRKEEVLMSLASVYSQQQQERNNFRIAPIMPIADRSQAEGAAMIYRFDVAVTILSWYEKLKKVGWYDQFRTRIVVDDETEKATIVDFNQT